MLSCIRSRLTYANVALTIGVMFTMTGGAYATKRYLITSTKQISPKVLRALDGREGKAGAQGPAGPAGPQGPVGAKGETGAPGILGAPGASGKEGSPWTAGGTLPTGKTEKGDWTVGVQSAEAGVMLAGVSFTLPLAHAPIPVYVKANAATPEHCTGTVQEPGAEAGYLCVFAKAETGVIQLSSANPNVCATAGKISPTECFDNGEDSSDPTGFAIAAILEKGGLTYGTWAVTAE